MTGRTNGDRRPASADAGVAAAVPDDPVGRLVGPVDVGPIAHGGHCVARHDGRVIFVRHTIPGEQVMVQITEARSRFWRGDAVEILRAGADRVAPPCPVARPGGCGGCDFQHVALPAQRRLKAEVLAEQLHRLAGVDLAVPVEPVPLPGRRDGVDDGLGWRTRMRYLLDQDGRPGLRAHRSHTVVPLPAGGCRIADAPIGRPADGPPGTELVAVTAADGAHWLPVSGRQHRAAGRDRPAVETITEHAVGRDWQVAADAFWQVHPAAAEVLVEAVLTGLSPQPGQRALDLYCGVGLFAGGLVDAGCRVIGVESARSAVAAARHNLADAPDRATFVADRVDRALRRPPHRGGLPARFDLVVLDPPRSGAGADVLAAITRRRPSRIAYVACDPAALGRDLGLLADLGYRLTSLRAFDLFPMTQHLEAVAVLAPADQPTTGRS